MPLYRDHGVWQTPEYRAWRGIIRRCTLPTNPAYSKYGGRGIQVCDRWRLSFHAFVEDVGMRPSPELSLDRIDNDGHYEPGNVRWATRKTQQRNKRNNRVLKLNGESRSVSEWAEIYGTYPQRITQRLAQGWSPEKAITTPSRDYCRVQ